MPTHKTDVTILGAGVLGLFLAKKLSNLGVSAYLLEKNQTLASGPSTKNEGWLHNGTYHATSIPATEEAIRVAQRCMYGHQQIREFCPESIENPDKHSYALLQSPERTEDIITRWNEAGVPYKPVSKTFLTSRVPQINLESFCEAFEVNDVGINTRILYAKLAHATSSNGIKIITSVTPTFTDQNILHVETPTDNFDLESRMYIHTAGFGNKNIMKQNFGIDLPIRFWKSHLIVTPRFTDYDTFFLDAGAVGMMSHNDVSIIGMNEDAIPIESPNYTIHHDRIERLLDALKKSYSLESLNYIPIACVKADLPKDLSMTRSLNVSVVEPLKNHLVAFPGKMTEAPYLADFLVKAIFEKLPEESSGISFRPCDKPSNRLLCKQGIDIEGNHVLKKIKDLSIGNLEIEVATTYSKTHSDRNIHVPTYEGVYHINGKLCLVMEHLQGDNLLGNQDPELHDTLVRDLALFHEVFSSDPLQVSPVVIYRDAIKSNYIITPDKKLVHIDFSSSNHFVHALDDLALLLHPSWGELPLDDVLKLKTVYFEEREKQHRLNTHSLPPGLAPLISKTDLKQHYTSKIDEMITAGIETPKEINYFHQVNFSTLNPDDYTFFKAFRTMRAQYYLKTIWETKSIMRAA